MHSESLISNIQYPELLNDRSLLQLNEILDEYPFFQTAQLLRIKNLHNQGSISFDRELKKTAIWVTDRRKLFYLLDERVLLHVDEEEKSESEIYNSTDVIDFSSLTTATELAEEYIEEEEQVAKDELDSIIRSGSASLGNFFAVEDKVDLDEFKNTFNKQKESDIEISQTASQSKNDLLIDSFIKDKPRIIQKEPTEDNAYIVDFSKSNDEDSSDLMTDTLAQIYVKQGLYEKAILTYEKLSLKYPEKKFYFAGQIEKIKQISNNK